MIYAINKLGCFPEAPSGDSPICSNCRSIIVRISAYFDLFVPLSIKVVMFRNPLIYVF